MAQRVLLTGATGFVGNRLYPALVDAGIEVRCASRDPMRARESRPDAQWVHFEVGTPDTVAAALEGCEAAYYFVHGMAGHGDYEDAERRAAESFAVQAERAGLRRIIYLGGVAPQGVPSKHLRSRLATGSLLRAGSVPTVELRAGMIIGPGSQSWRIVRDLAARLPVMVLPRWLESRSQPVAIEDVVAALCGALTISDEDVGCYDLPGPETLSAREILLRVSALRGIRPLVIDVPVITPRLSSYWIQLVTRANHEIAAELVEGLTSDLVATLRPFWSHLPQHRLMSFDAAARAAMAEEASELALRSLVLERTVRALARKPKRP